MFPPKKKPSLMIMMGKGKGPDPEEPDSIEKPKPAPIANPFSKAAPPAADESSEAPGYESQEESGASLMQDIEAAGAKHGMDGGQSRAVAADFFSAIAECLRRGEQGQDQEGAGDSQTQDYPA